MPTYSDYLEILVNMTATGWTYEDAEGIISWALSHTEKISLEEALQRLRQDFQGYRMAHKRAGCENWREIGRGKRGKRGKK